MSCTLTPLDTESANGRGLARRPTATWLLAAWMLPLAACADRGREPERTTTRDSAGARIAESVLPAGAEGPIWLVDTQPAVVVGDGRSPDHELNRVRAAVRLADGRIVVANGRPLELRIFDSSGVFLGRTGREGAGPGEFRASPPCTGFPATRCSSSIGPLDASACSAPIGQTSPLVAPERTT